MNTVSVVISAFNEEANIGRCLQSVQWADEIVVVNSGSIDKTVQIAKKFRAKVFLQKNNPMLNVNKNFGFEQATGSWILNVDADEEVPEALAKEIQHANPSVDVIGYWIARKNIIFGRWIKHGLWWPDKQLRLFRRGQGKFPCKHVHEKIEVEGKTEELTSPFVHYNYQSISQFIRKMDSIYSTNQMENLQSSGYRFSWADAIRFPVSDFNKIFFAQQGYKDGLHGLVLSILQAFVSFVVFAKYWEQQGFVDIPLSGNQVSGELSRAGREIEYWSLTSRIEQIRQPLSKIYLRLKRKLIKTS